MALKNVTLGEEDTILLFPNRKTVVFSIMFCNLTEDPVEIDMHAFPEGGTVGDGNKVINKYIVPATDTLIWESPDKFILEKGDMIEAKANTSDAIAATINYLEV